MKNLELQPEIIYEDKDFLVINKPAFLLIQPTKYEKENTLVDFLKEHYPAIKDIGQKERPGIVHRLDKDVSGVLVVAKNQKVYNLLVSQFKNRQIKKEYLGLVFGKPPQDKGEIDFPLARTKKGKIVAVRPACQSLRLKPLAGRPACQSLRLKPLAGRFEGKLKMKKEAMTKYEVIKKFERYSLLKIEPLTGRTNQIKIHLKTIGCPLVRTQGRVFLHAVLIGFYDLENKWREFKAPLAQGLKNFLEKIE